MPDPVPQEQGARLERVPGLRGPIAHVGAQEQGVDPVERVIASKLGSIERVMHPRSVDRRAWLAKECAEALRDAGLLSPSLSREEAEALYWSSVVKEDPDIPTEAWESGRAKLERWLATGETE